ncbi:MAG: 2OG-Fe(II) oxygenase [Gammaproteobacteria bacterium]|nr:MAG: 2OG-Fe(II) oxygenase [Gammaproteobacteria bacterium]
MTTLVNLGALDAAPIIHDPFDHLMTSEAISAEDSARIIADYPEVPTAGNYRPEEVTYGPTFGDLMTELRSQELADRMGAKFGVRLDATTQTITIRDRSELSDGDIHLDHWTKVVTALLYFNPEWQHEGGRLRLLRSKDDIEDYATEVLPTCGTLVAFKRCGRSFHGHRRHVGTRRMVQISWNRSGVVAKFAQTASRLSTRTMKRLLRIFAKR